MSAPTGRLIPWAEAYQFAVSVLAILRPLCWRISIAGSVRRRVAQVHDVDLVAIPRDYGTFRQRVFARATPLVDGLVQLSALTRGGTRLDIYLAHDDRRELFGVTPSNWGSILLCRTGPADANARLATACKLNRRRWVIQDGIIDDNTTVIAGRTEREIYAALGWPYLPPPQRDRAMTELTKGVL